MPAADPTLPEAALAAVATQAKATAKAMTGLAKSATAAKTGAIGDLRALQKALNAAKDAAGAIGTATAELQPQVAQQLAELERLQRFEFAKTLQDALATQGAVAKRISDTPLEYRAGKLTLVVDFKADAVRFRYAQCDLPNATATTQAASLAATYRRASTELDKAATKLEDFGVALERAYRGLLGKRKLGFGERVDLVELHREVALELRPKLATGDAKSAAPYTKAMFSHDVARLRATGKLLVGGYRMSLTTATGGTAFEADKVLVVEDDAGGQKYLSFQLVAPRSGESA